MTDTGAPSPGPTGAANQETFVFVDGSWDLRHTYRRDPLAGPFLAGLREGRLLGVADPASGRVFFPPHTQWDEPYAELTELAEVGPGGVIRTLTGIPGRGSEPSPMLVVAYVQLDGAASVAPACLRLEPGEAPELLGLIGARCRAVIADQPAGDFDDYWYELEG